MQQDEEYDASKIIVLEGAQGIRKRPAMYIGTTSSAGVLHLLFEVLDNAVDEALAGYAKNITVRLSQNDTADIAEVSDDGRGIPVGMIPKYGKSALEIVMTTLHKGAKFDNKIYKISGGLHGVGLTVVNALSEYTEVTVKTEGKAYRQTFSKGNVRTPLEVLGETKETGTTVKFKPDASIFPSPKFDSALLKDRLRYTAFLNPGLRIKLIDDRFNAHEESAFFSQNGLEDFLRHINKEQEAISSIIRDKRQGDGVSVEFALQYVNTYEERLESFVNDIRTPEGGTHVIGFHSGLSRAVIGYASRNQNHKPDFKLTGDDTREGLTAIVSVFMQNPEFEGQTKEKLGNSAVKSLVEASVYASLSRYLEEHPAEARKISEKAINAMNARESARRARELARQKNVFESAVLPGTLADCIDDDPERTELFIVEGKSAGGSSKEGRDKQVQAILPLRGKILNVEKAGDERVFSSAALNMLVTALGTGIKETFNPGKVRYKKIIIMSDADVDGEHIRTLLLTFFYRFMPKLIENGYVYIAQPPLYKVSAGKSMAYCYTDDELQAKRKEYDGKMEVQRYKGLGEMNAEQLWDTTMNPSNRILKRVNITDAERANTLFSVLMGVDVGQRRKFLEEHSGDVKFLDV